MKTQLFGLVVCSVALLACRLGKLFGEKEEAPSAAAAPAPLPPELLPKAPAAIATPSASAAPTTPASEYSMTGISPTVDNCKDAWAVLATVPAALHEKPDFFWRFARQVFFANPNLGYGIPEAPARVMFHEGPHQPTGGFALIAHCPSGLDCNRVAAAYKIVVPTSRPEVVCGKPPPTISVGPGASVLEFELGPQGLRVPTEKNLPGKDDVVSQCVRLAACKAERDKKLEGDPAIQCQKRPSDFKPSCALKSPCSAVLACSGD